MGASQREHPRCLLCTLGNKAPGFPNAATSVAGRNRTCLRVTSMLHSDAYFFCLRERFGLSTWKTCVTYEQRRTHARTHARTHPRIHAYMPRTDAQQSKPVACTCRNSMHIISLRAASNPLLWRMAQGADHNHWAVAQVPPRLLWWWWWW